MFGSNNSAFFKPLEQGVVTFVNGNITDALFGTGTVCIWRKDFFGPNRLMLSSFSIEATSQDGRIFISGQVDRKRSYFFEVRTDANYEPTTTLKAKKKPNR